MLRIEEPAAWVPASSLLPCVQRVAEPPWWEERGHLSLVEPSVRAQSTSLLVYKSLCGWMLCPKQVARPEDRAFM